MPDALSSALLCALLAAVVLAQVFRKGPITPQRLQGAVAVYLLVGLAWAFIYEAIALRWPQAFTLSATALTEASAGISVYTSCTSASSR